MEYPRKPSFNDIFWYQVVINDGSTWLCTTTGLEFVYQLQRVLQDAGIPSAPSYDGVAAGSSDIEADGIWAATTQRVLWLAAQRAGLPAEFITGIGLNGTGHHLLGSSVYSAIYIIMSLSATSGLFIETGTGLEILRVQAFDPPVWGVRPPAVGVHNPPRDVTCILQVPSPAPGVPTVPIAGAGEVQQAADPAPVAQGAPSLPIPVGQPATRVDLINTPPGRLPTTVVQEGLTIGPILVVVGVLGIIVLFTAEVTRGSARTNPADAEAASIRADIRDQQRWDASQPASSEDVEAHRIAAALHRRAGQEGRAMYHDKRAVKLAEWVEREQAEGRRSARARAADRAAGRI